MAEISRPAGDATTSLHSELDGMPASPADLIDAAAEAVTLDVAMASSPSLPVYNSSGSVSDSVSCPQLPAAVSVTTVTSGSPTALAASCSSTPPTPQSHAGSESSPGLHSDPAVTMPPPPYSAHGPAADLSAVLAVPTSDPLTQTDGVRSHLPPPPKKPLTPYMRFSKSVSSVCAHKFEQLVWF